MAFPTAAKSAIEMLKQGPVEVVFNPGGGANEVLLMVREGADITISPGQEVAEADVVGAYDIFTTGDGATVSLNLDAWDLKVLGVLYPTGTSNAYYRGIGKTAGVSMRQYAQSLRIRPWQTRDSATTEVMLWKVVPEGDVGMSLTKAAPHSNSITFRALPDLTKADGELIGQIKSPTRS